MRKMADRMTDHPGKSAALCPICREKTDQDWRPFCSKRCADVDLGRWMTGRYVVPTDEPATPETES